MKETRILVVEEDVVVIIQNNSSIELLFSELEKAYLDIKKLREN